MITYHVDDGKFALSISGEINLNSLPAIRSKVEELKMDSYKDIVIDLEKVTFLDSSGMGYLVVLIKNVRSRGATIKLRAPSQSVRRMLSAIRMDRYVVITDADGNQVNQAEMEEMAETNEAE